MITIIARFFLVITFCLNLFSKDYETSAERSKKNDYIKTNEFFEKACNSGYAIACNNLATKYMNAEGTKQDIEKAKEFYGKACNFGLQAGCKNVLMLDKK